MLVYWKPFLEIVEMPKNWYSVSSVFVDLTGWGAGLWYSSFKSCTYLQHMQMGVVIRFHWIYFYGNVAAFGTFCRFSGNTVKTSSEFEKLFRQPNNGHNFFWCSSDLGKYFDASTQFGHWIESIYPLLSQCDKKWRRFYFSRNTKQTY